MRVCMCGCSLERYQQNKSPEEIKIVLRGRQNWVEKEPEGGLIRLSAKKQSMEPESKGPGFESQNW